MNIEEMKLLPKGRQKEIYDKVAAARKLGKTVNYAATYALVLQQYLGQPAYQSTRQLSYTLHIGD